MKESALVLKDRALTVGDIVKRKPSDVERFVQNTPASSFKIDVLKWYGLEDLNFVSLAAHLQ